MRYKRIAKTSSLPLKLKQGREGQTLKNVMRFDHLSYNL